MSTDEQLWRQVPSKYHPQQRIPVCCTSIKVYYDNMRPKVVSVIYIYIYIYIYTFALYICLPFHCSTHNNYSPYQFSHPMYKTMQDSIQYI